MKRHTDPLLVEPFEFEPNSMGILLTFLEIFEVVD